MVDVWKMKCDLPLFISIQHRLTESRMLFNVAKYVLLYKNDVVSRAVVDNNDRKRSWLKKRKKRIQQVFSAGHISCVTRRGAARGNCRAARRGEGQARGFVDRFRPPPPPPYHVTL
ncbi:hypothetical protein J6590_105485 [Homalodisca vitripennis]|nr:hypothetical protein J6590_105485 [Homalodisca vitripennis]